MLFWCKFDPSQKTHQKDLTLQNPTITNDPKTHQHERSFLLAGLVVQKGPPRADPKKAKAKAENWNSNLQQEVETAHTREKDKSKS